MQPIDEVEASLRNFGDRYRRRLFTDHELESCGEGEACAARLAERFAAKEAFLKVLDVNEIIPTWRSIEVKCSSDGRTEIVLYDGADILARRQGIRKLSVSLSRAAGVATAAVVATVTTLPLGG
jgi:holo-[acyl-carrier protein] synthase